MYNMYTKNIDWLAKKRIAKKMSNSELKYAINDCLICVKNMIDGGYYQDEASIYSQELKTR